MHFTAASKSMILSFLLIFVSIFRNSYQQTDDTLYEDHFCWNDDGQAGICTRLHNCSTGIQAVKEKNPHKICSFIEFTPIVCCPPGEIKKSLPLEPVKITTEGPDVSQPTEFDITSHAGTARKKCIEYANVIGIKIDIYEIESIRRKAVPGRQVFKTFVVGGEDASAKEFPHMALIGYLEKDPEWKCGGSLISDRFVISAAHCSNSEIFGKALWAKLGDLDTSSEKDDAQPEIFKIIEIIVHPLYDPVTLYNDLTLFKLEKSVTFNSYIRPICLSTFEVISEEISASAIGWGLKSYAGVESSILQKVKLDLVNHSRCDWQYKNVKQKIPQGIKESMLCAGGIIGLDTCQGDSGGPLQTILNSDMIDKRVYDLLGLTSFGRACGKGFPGIYTRISHFVPWIVENVWSE